MALITIAEYETYTNEQIIGVLPTPYADGILEAVSDDVQNWCDQTFGSHTNTNERVDAIGMQYNRQPVLYVKVADTPVTAISSLAIWYAIDADPTTLDVDDAVINTARTGFYIPFGAFGLWQTFFRIGQTYTGRVTYTAGEATPDAVKRAVALLAQENFALDADSTRQGTDQVEQFKIGDYQEKKAARDLSASEGLGLGTQNSVLAARLLRKYSREGVMLL